MNTTGDSQQQPTPTSAQMTDDQACLEYFTELHRKNYVAFMQELNDSFMAIREVDLALVELKMRDKEAHSFPSPTGMTMIQKSEGDHGHRHHSKLHRSVDGQHGIS